MIQFRDDSPLFPFFLSFSLSFIDRKAAQFLSLIVFVADGLVRFEPHAAAANSAAARYLRISSQLPLELQMVVARRTVRSLKEIVASRWIEGECIKLAYYFDRLSPLLR